MILTDILVVGAGPAGLQAAIYASRSKVKTLIVGKVKFSGLVKAHLENYCCIDGKLQGLDFLEHGVKQAKSFGAEMLEQEVLKVDKVDGEFRVATDGGDEILTKALILATGVRRNRLGVRGEEEYVGRGVSYCIECDANFFKGKIVAVAGGGSAAASGALLMKAYAQRVYLVSEVLDVGERLRSQLEASGIKVLQRRIEEIQGDQRVRRLIFTDKSSLDVDGVFVELGQKGAVSLVSGIGVLLNDEGYVMTNRSQETNVPGLFAAGDVCGPPFQVAKSVGEGCVAGLSAVKYVRRV
ncbi:FAD-dependent oxidoreductase [Candidatus Bathyarchaeota archaeon]|nr:FAD-dependent oxidoreductase [Candidatus Bathyarchaeota archaeon]